MNGRISALLELGAGFNMEYNGIENIYLNGTMIGFTEKEIEARMDSILSFADIGEYIYQPVKMYSSGMFMRLAFAVAINPEILVSLESHRLRPQNVLFQKTANWKVNLSILPRPEVNDTTPSLWWCYPLPGAKVISG